MKRFRFNFFGKDIRIQIDARKKHQGYNAHLQCQKTFCDFQKGQIYDVIDSRMYDDAGFEWSIMSILNANLLTEFKEVEDRDIVKI